MKKIFKPP